MGSPCLSFQNMAAVGSGCWVMVCVIRCVMALPLPRTGGNSQLERWYYKYRLETQIGAKSQIITAGYTTERGFAWPTFFGKRTKWATAVHKAVQSLPQFRGLPLATAAVCGSLKTGDEDHYQLARQKRWRQVSVWVNLCKKKCLIWIFGHSERPPLLSWPCRAPEMVSTTMHLSPAPVGFIRYTFSGASASAAVDAVHFWPDAIFYRV